MAKAIFTGDYRRRDLMHKSHIEPFTQWLITQGWEPQKLLVWEVIRMRKDKATLIVWLKNAAKEHCTVQGVSKHWFHKWQDSKKEQENKHGT